MIRRISTLVSAIVLTLALAACGAMPTSGDVQAGDLAGDAGTSDVSLLASGPRQGSTPEQIVRDFMQAAKSPAGGWSTAQLYLAPDAEPWDPNAGAMIDNGLREVTVVDGGTEAETVVTVRAEYDAVLDEEAVYSEFEPEETELGYRLKKVDGEWRITHAPPGILIERGVFASTVFGQYTLVFWDPTWTYLVPDQRWYPRALATGRVARGLLAGPSTMLRESVVNAFPQGASVVEGSSQVEGDFARVAITDAGEALDPTTIGRMRLQLQTSLKVRDVQLTINGAAVSEPAAEAIGTAVDTRPIVLTDDGFGYLSGPEITPIPGYTEALSQLKVKNMAIAVNRNTAVVQDDRGWVWRLTQEEPDPSIVDDRPGQLPPTIDPWGYIWSVQASASGSLRVTNPTGERLTISGDTTMMTAMSGLSVSRDGTRLAVAASVDGQTKLGYVGIIRNRDGVPTGLGPFSAIEVLPSKAVDIEWLDDLTIGVIVSTKEGLVFMDQMIGGIGEKLTLPAEARFLAGTNSAGTVRMLTGDGTMFSRREAQWTQTGTDILLIATQTATG